MTSDLLAVLYARYSTKEQSPLSNPDQIRDVRANLLPRHGLREVGCYSDEARSGFRWKRRGLQAALCDIKAGRATALVAESFTRISRDQEHGPRILKLVTNWGGKIITLQEGEVNSMIVGMVCTSSQMTQDTHKRHTRRGLQGVVERGRIPSRPAYGYEKTGEVGVFRINEDEAAIVRRIFRKYAAGQNPRDIVRELNADGIPGPTGGLWKANTIVGDRAVATGIINNMLYFGWIAWNRQTWHVDPDTETRRSKPVPMDQWVTKDAPEYRIVDEALWNRVRERQGEFVARGKVRRSTRPLSRLLICEVCGKPMTILGRERYGCPTHKEHGKGYCSNDRTAAAVDIEGCALANLRQQLLNPRLTPTFARAFARELKHLRNADLDASASTRQELATAEAEQRQLAEALGKVPATAMDAVLTRLAQVGERIQTLRSQLPAGSGAGNIVDFGIPSDFLERNLDQLWRKMMIDPTAGADVREALATLLGSIRFTPGEGRGAYTLSFEKGCPVGH